MPTGEVLSAKLCQDGAKALMTNPNNALSDWLLRNVLNLQERKLATYQHLEVAGFDSVIVYQECDSCYRVDVVGLDSYESFMEGV